VHVLGLAVTPVQLVVFVATILLMSPSIPGVPAVNSVVRSLPVYVAAGVPAEYVVLIGTTEWMNDMIMTVLNSTGYLTAAVLVERFAGQRRAEAIQGAQPAEATGADDLAIRPRKSMEGTS
jgi:Na+/H+-dicarboxylate symporter